MKALLWIYLTGYVGCLFTWVLSSEQRNILRTGQTDIVGIMLGSLLYPLSLIHILYDILNKTK